MWGENATGDDRKKAKGLNFGGVYGLSPYSIAEKYEVSQSEAQDIYDKFWGAIPEVAQFQARTIRNAKKTGTCYNYFGRPRRVKHWLSSSDWKQKAFGERTCKNSPIQSAGADIMKLAMIKVYRKLLTNPKYEGKVKFLSTIHDELNLSINYEDRELFLEMFKIFHDCMRCQFPGWDVPFEVGLEIGIAWGDSFTFEYDKDGNLVPTMEYKPLVEDVKVEEVEVEATNIKINQEEEFSFDLDF